jgi:hypothetical protein
VPVQARGYDDLPSEALAGIERAHVGSVEADALRGALSASVIALLTEGTDADLPDVNLVAQRLAPLR